MARNRGTEISQIMTKANAKRNSRHNSNISIQLDERLNTVILEVINDFYKKLMTRFVSFRWRYRDDITVSISPDELVVSFPAYLDFQDKGVNGKKVNHGSKYSFKNKMPPLSAISSWAKAKGISPSNGQSEKSLYFALQKGIYNNGITPKDFYGDLIEQLKIDIIREISNGSNYEDIIVEQIETTIDLRFGV